ncbi:MAG: S46 family peptidase [Cryomorphaceae bacterium]
MKSLYRFAFVLPLAVFILFFSDALRAHEGMWIPSTLQKLVIGDMQAAGLELSAEDIYSINQSSIKDAIVHFGGGCTAEVISRKGLILTNHHCGYSQIQSHSSVEQDYLTDGFWAGEFGEELPNSGLTATFVVRIEDVTDALNSAAEGLEGMEREAALRIQASALIAEASNGNGYTAEINPYFYGNAFYMVVKETFRDVRLVGAPPSSIGKFGGDTDNWEWPRHTGDFSIFRIYADADNNPADYSEDNVPYTPKHSLPINMDGLKPDDYTMVFGFPGTTEQFLTSDAVAYVLERANPARKAMREASLGVIDAAMLSSDTIRIQYAAKQSRISNAHKKWIGQTMGLERFDALAKKRKFEEEYREKAAASGEFDPEVPERLGALYEEFGDYAFARDYLIEFYYYGPEIFRFAEQFSDVAQHYDSLSDAGLLEGQIEKLKASAERHFKNYNKATDSRVMAAQLPLFLNGCPELLVPPVLRDYERKFKGDGLLMAGEIYKNTVFADKDELIKLLGKSGKGISKTILKDPAYLAATGMIDAYRDEVMEGYGMFKGAEGELMREYVKAIMALFPDKNYWPDANSTLRITFGKMEGSKPRDAMKYLPYSTLEGIAQKYIPGHRDFDVHERLLELHSERDYGKYATDGELRVCFLGSNHTTGGNSGSPALDARGHLVGLNFDRTWESTMSDIMFNPEICRNIMVDIKYVLFIVDKFAGASHLIDEMELVYASAKADAETPRAEPETIKN